MQKCKKHIILQQLFNILYYLTLYAADTLIYLNAFTGDIMNENLYSLYST